MQSMKINTDGKILDIKPSNGNTFSLKEMQSFVNGTVERHVISKHKVYMLINEEGKLLNLPTNDAATLLFQEEYGKSDWIVGDVALIQYGEIK